MYVALRTMNIGDGQRDPGADVPEVVSWNPSVVTNLIRNGHIRDMGEEEARLYKASIAVDVRMSKVKRAHKIRRAARMRLAQALAKIDKLERVMKPLREAAGGYEKEIAEAEAVLTEFDAHGEPEKPSRQQRHEMRAASILKSEAKARELRAPEPKADAEPRAGEPSEGTKLRVRLGGHTVPQLNELAGDMKLDLDNLGSRPAKADLVEYVASAMEARDEDEDDDSDETATDADD